MCNPLENDICNNRNGIAWYLFFIYTSSKVRIEFFSLSLAFFWDQLENIFYLHKN